MKNQHLGSLCLCVDLHAPTQQVIRVELFRPDHGGAVYGIKIAQKVVKIPQLFDGHVENRLALGRHHVLHHLRVPHRVSVLIYKMPVVGLVFQYFGNGLLILHGRPVLDLRIQIFHQRNPVKCLF